MPDSVLRWISYAALVVAAVFALSAGVLLLGLPTSPSNAGLASALAAGSALFFTAWQSGQRTAAEQSQFALQQAMEGVRSALTILHNDADNRGLRTTRIQWVNGARVLARALETAKGITDKSHKNAWDLFREEWRLKFLFYVQRSPEYYLGLYEPLDYETTTKNYGDEKVIELLKRTNVEREFNMSHYHSSSTSNSDLAEDSIKVIYDFVEFGSDWTDPLDSVASFTAEQVEAIGHRDMEGLHVYLRAKRKWMVLGDTVTEWSALKKDGPSEGGGEIRV